LSASVLVARGLGGRENVKEYHTEIKHKYFASIATKYSLAYNYIHYMFQPTWAILR
jgi:hypothetical protein